MQSLHNRLRFGFVLGLDASLYFPMLMLNKFFYSPPLQDSLSTLPGAAKKLVMSDKLVSIEMQQNRPLNEDGYAL
jgi:hypothetical protein